MSFKLISTSLQPPNPSYSMFSFILPKRTCAHDLNRINHSNSKHSHTFITFQVHFKSIAWMDAFSLHTNIKGWHYYFVHFSDEENKAQKCQVTWLSHPYSSWKGHLNPASLAPQCMLLITIPVLNTYLTLDLVEMSITTEIGQGWRLETEHL